MAYEAFLSELAQPSTSAVSKPKASKKKSGNGKGTLEGLQEDGAVLQIDPAAPYDNAQIFVKKKYHVDAIRILQYWQNDYYRWDGSAYKMIEADDIKSELYDFFKSATFLDKQGEERLFNPTRHKVSDLVDALKGFANLSSGKNPPCWLNGNTEPAAAEIISCKNGLFHPPTLTLHKPDPAFFTLSALPFEYDANAAEPVEWLKFMDSLWGDDQEQIDTLQEMFGYFLTSDTTQQKMFLMIGPKRSGKGTIARVLRELLGTSNVAGPTLASLSNQFGVQPLIGMKLAIVSDARLGSQINQHTITERLLSISGEDLISIPRKHKTDYTTQLDVKFLLMTNELPRLADASGALSSRFIVSHMPNSFYGREDPGLTSKLLKELPGILNWAITGAQNLFLRGYFVQPQNCAELIEELEDLTSPVNAFVKDECVVNPNSEIELKRLFLAWSDWCDEQGRDHKGTVSTFGKNLRAAVPTIKGTQPRKDGKQVRAYRGITLKCLWKINDGIDTR